jgi:hypothetical protein
MSHDSFDYACRSRPQNPGRCWHAKVTLWKRAGDRSKRSLLHGLEHPLAVDAATETGPS